MLARSETNSDSELITAFSDDSTFGRVSDTPAADVVVVVDAVVAISSS